MDLSAEQQAAVEYTGTPALVVAGAGSGKTRTLTAKIAHLIDTGIKPERILAITFTNKAAEEMKDRLVKITGLSIDRFPWVRTFHSACFRILKKHCHLLGYNAPLQIYSVYQQQKTVKDIIVDKMNFEKKYISSVCSRISNAKNFGNARAYFDAKPWVGGIPMAEVFELYERELKIKNAVDFDNILMLARDILKENVQVRENYKNLFQYVLVDEYQDTNNLQEELTRLLLKNGNLFCVGDDWQAIYSFRGSNVDHFLSFKDKYDGAKIFRLEQNYRSADNIVQIANDLIGYNENRMDKTCFSDKENGSVEIYDFFDEREEAEWVVGKIQLLNAQGLRYDEMAILYRTKFCSLAFEQALRKYGIPYHMLGGKGFFERKEILDLNCYLTAAIFSKDDVSFERIANTPKRGIGPGTIKKIAQFKTEDVSLQDAARIALENKIFSKKIYNSLLEVVTLLDDIKTMKPDMAIREVLRQTSYMDYLQAYSKSGSMDFTVKEENIEQLVYSASQKDDIVEYLEEAALIREDKKDEGDDNGFGVNMATIHAAKGLEFKGVFVVGCEEKLFPHWKCMENDAGLEEERRLMYVAVTRGEQYLHLTSANFRKGQYSQRSRFIDEIQESVSS
ncbi:MAG: ATP-dependent helicase [Desulfobacterales bacterium]|nr:ATP-dependent helicase [Desulfobacterales bacterium]